MTDFPISKIINVSLLSTPLGLSDFNVNTLALFTNETPNASFGSAAYKIYKSPDGVLTDFGSTSEAYLQAVAVFSQSPNILTGSGYLVIIPLVVLGAASAGVMTTGTSLTDLTAWKAITAGSMAVTVDGAAKTLSALDFHSVTNLAGVATVITSGSTGFVCTYDPTVNNATGGFVFTSSTTGILSKVTKLVASGSGTDISNSGFLNGAGLVTIVNGQALSDTENIVTAIARTKNSVYYFGVMHVTQPAVADVLNLATYMQTQDKLYFLGRTLSAELTTLFLVIQAAGLTHTRMLYYTVTAQSARIAMAAYASRLLGINFDGSNTMCTMNLKTLAGITPDPSAATDAVDIAAQTYGFDIYVSIGGDPSVVSYGANGYSDDVYGSLWLKLAMQIAGYNYLKTTNTKIPQTEPGMDGLKGAYAKVCEQAVTNNLVGRGLTWTSASTFGDPQDFARNIKDMGYYIYSLPMALQSATDRAARKAPLVNIAVKLSGAIHHSDVVISVQ